MSQQTIAVIDASHLGTVLVARKIKTISARWCVMSHHTVTQDCRRGGGSYRITARSTAQPMSRGSWYRALNRSASVDGTKALRRIYGGAGIKALYAENLYLVER